MRYLDIKDFDINNGDGFRVSLWVSGCEFKCKNCHNKEAWDKDNGQLYTKETEGEILEMLELDYSKDLSILGGEPLTPYNRGTVLELCKAVKRVYPNKTIWLWSGYTYEDITVEYPEILKYIDVLVDGLYMEEYKDDTLMWRGSANQRIFKLK